MPRSRVIRSLVVSLSIGLLWTLPMHAQDDGDDEPDYGRTGAYVGIAGSTAFPQSLNVQQDELQATYGINPFLPIPVTFFEVLSKRSLGFQAKAGYRFHRHFGAEAHFEWLTDRSQFGSVSANLKGYLTTGRAQPYVNAGVGYATTNGKDFCGGGNYARALCKQSMRQADDLVMRFGGGFDVYATEQIVLSIDAIYVLPQGRNNNLDYISVGWGVGYRF